MKGTGVYSITNKVNGKRYVGSTASSFLNRWSRHTKDLKSNKHHSVRLQRAWNKYSADNFVFEVLATCPKEYCIKLEQWFLDKLNPDYNSSPTAGSCLGIKKTGKVLDDLVERMRLFRCSEEGKKKISEGQKRRYARPEEKERLKKVQLEYARSEKGREKNKESIKKYFSNPENRKKQSEKIKKKYLDPEFKAKYLIRIKEVMGTKEAREKNRQGQLKRFSDPKQRQAHKDSRCKFLYKIQDKDGAELSIRYMRDFLKDNGISMAAYQYWNKGLSYKGYKLLSKTPIK